MTHPTTEQSIRERLARIAQESLTRGAFLDMEEWQIATDAILAELQEPSEGMKVASGRIAHARDEEIWRAMIRHIRDGGK